jgi:hypothetical protein
MLLELVDDGAVKVVTGGIAASLKYALWWFY